MRRRCLPFAIFVTPTSVATLSLTCNLSRHSSFFRAGPSKLHPGLRIGQTEPDIGLGLFATQLLPRGSYLFAFEAPLIDNEQALLVSNPGDSAYLAFGAAQFSRFLLPRRCPALLRLSSPSSNVYHPCVFRQCKSRRTRTCTSICKRATRACS